MAFCSINKISITKLDSLGVLQIVDEIEMSAPISAICANKEAKLLYVCEFDSPFYSLTVFKDFRDKTHQVSLT